MVVKEGLAVMIGMRTRKPGWRETYLGQVGVLEINKVEDGDFIRFDIMASCLTSSLGKIHEIPTGLVIETKNSLYAFQWIDDEKDS